MRINNSVADYHTIIYPCEICFGQGYLYLDRNGFYNYFMDYFSDAKLKDKKAIVKEWKETNRAFCIACRGRGEIEEKF